MSKYDTVIIGAGLSGLVTASQLAQANQKVLLIAGGIGALLLTSGCIDLLGYASAASKEPVNKPLEEIDIFLAGQPKHPYHFVGKETIEAGLEAFCQIINQDGVLNYVGSANRNWLLPSTIGAIHPTCLAPTSLANGALNKDGPMLIVGFREMRDFYPALISQNLNAQNMGIQADSLVIDAPAPAAGSMNITPIELAQSFEITEFRQQVAKIINASGSKYHRVGFPAVLGLKQHSDVLADLEKRLGKTVFEISTLPPSVPGRRLFEALRRSISKANGRMIIGSKVVDGNIQDGRVTQIRFETSNRLQTIQANNYVLATGGLFGGGIQTDDEGQLWEPIFGLPVKGDQDRHRWFAKGFLDSSGQPVARYGVSINRQLNPIDPDSGGSAPIAENLYIAGSLIADSDWVLGRTGDGVALATAAAIVKQLI